MKLRQTQFILNGKRPEACGDLLRMRGKKKK